LSAKLVDCLLESGETESLIWRLKKTAPIA
jgi:hypothetical protein